MRHWKVNGSRLYHIPRAGQLRGSGLVDTAHAVTDRTLDPEELNDV